jgi:hypothetical protein
MKTRIKFYDKDITVPEFGIEVNYSESELKAIMYVGKSAKPVWHYRFKKPEDMHGRIRHDVEYYTLEAEKKAANNAAKKTANAALVASDHFNIGDIIVNTWGWEQTNVEFYQVVAVLNKKIKVVEIAHSTVEGSEGFMSCNVMPRMDAFCSDERTLSLKVDVWDGKQVVNICNPERYYYFHKWDGRPQYKSWYA